MSLSPPRPVPLKMNPDSDVEPSMPPLPLLTLTDEVIPSSRGIPLHTRYTRRNQILIATFRKLVFFEVLANLHIRLDADVMDVIELYTFERTYPFVPHVKTEYRRSLFREEDILDLLTPCKQGANTSSWEDDDVMDCLIGRVLYGFDIHDSRYGTVDDPNPCEIMTNEGGIYLVPDKMSDWFLYQDGECVALPALFRFKHCITDARVISRRAGPFLRLEIKPVHSIIPGKDAVLHNAQLDSPIKVDDSDLESFTSCDIDPNLLNYTYTRSHNSDDDSLAAEITNCWKSTRESVLVVVNPQTPPEEDESMDPFKSVFSPVLDNHYLSDSPQELDALKDSEKEDEEEFEEERKPYDELTSSEFPLGRPEHKDPSEDFVTSCTTTGGLSFTSAGSANFNSRTCNIESESDDENPNFSFRVDDKMRTRPSIMAESNSKASIVLEIGAGFIGIQDVSLSFLHKMATPNPHSCCSRDSSLECMELETIIV